MDSTLVAIVGIIILAFLGTGILWVRNAKEGSFGWHIKTRFFEASSRAEGEQRPDIEQIQKGGKENKQVASKEAKSRQTQTEGEKNRQEIK